MPITGAPDRLGRLVRLIRWITLQATLGRCSSRGIHPVVAGTLPCGTNHVTARLHPPLPQG